MDLSVGHYSSHPCTPPSDMIPTIIPQEIPSETLLWMESVGIRKFNEPQEYWNGLNFTYSKKYLRDTPLEVLKKRFDVRDINAGEQIENDGAIRTK